MIIKSLLEVILSSSEVHFVWGCIQCKNTQLMSPVLYMLFASGSISFVFLLVLLDLLLPIVVQFPILLIWYSFGSLVQLVRQFCWFISSVRLIVMLFHQFFWFTSSAGSLVPLVHQFCQFTSSAGSLVLLVHQFCQFASSVNSLVLLVR